MKNKFLVISILCFSLLCSSCQFFIRQQITDAPILEVEDVTSDSIKIKWSYIPGASFYYINYIEKGSEIYYTGKLTSNSGTITQLDSSTTYYIWIQASNYYSTGPSSNVASATTIIGCPTEFSAELRNDNKNVYLKWNSVANAKNYIIKHNSINSLSTAKIISTPKMLYFTHTNPNEGSNYYWISSVDETNESTNCNFTSIRTKPIEYNFYISDKLETRQNGAPYSEENLDIAVEASNISEVFIINTNISDTKGLSTFPRVNSRNNLSYPVINFNSNNATNNDFSPVFNDSDYISIDKEEVSRYNANFHLNPFSELLHSRASGETIHPKQQAYEPGNKRTFWADDTSGKYTEQNATLIKEGTNCYVWILDDYLDDHSTSNKDNKLSTTQIKNIADKFDAIYNAETNLFGTPYKDLPQEELNKISTSYVDPSQKIHILLLDIDKDYSASQTGGTFGYFWSKDLTYNKQSNQCEMFYIDVHFYDCAPNQVYSTLAHEFQHMLNFVNKQMLQNLSSGTWYNEMLSMIAEDILSSHIGINTVTNSRMKTFLQGYDITSIEEWNSGSVYNCYSNAYAFGAWLCRNYGGVNLINEMEHNNSTNFKCILDAVRKCNNEFASYSDDKLKEELFMQFSRALCYAELDENTYKDAVNNNMSNGLKAFVASTNEKKDEYTYELKPISLNIYSFTRDNKNFNSPYYFDLATEPTYVRANSFIVINYGNNSNTVIYTPSVEPVNGYVVVP